MIVYSATWRTRADDLERELANLVAECERAGLPATAAAGFQILSVVQYEGGKMDSARASTLRSLQGPRAAEPRAHAESLALTARCLTMIERDMPQAQAMLEEAPPSRRRSPTTCSSCSGRRGSLQLPGGSRGRLGVPGPGARLARRTQNPWAHFECVMHLVRIDLDQDRPAEALGRCAELSAIASKIAEGSEVAVASALEAVARVVAGESEPRREPQRKSQQDAEERLTRAMTALRLLDAKGTLAYALTVWARSDLRGGRLDWARAHAVEAVRSAQALNRRSDVATARALVGSIALAAGDPAEARRQLDAGCRRGGPLAVSAHARSQVLALATALGDSVPTMGSTEAPTATGENV